MTKKEIIEKIDMLTEMNREYKRTMNEELCRIRNAVQGDMLDKEGDGFYDSEIWRVVRKIIEMSGNTRYEIFGYSFMESIFTGFNYPEIKKMLDDYENKLIEKENGCKTFKRGDIVTVVYKDDGTVIDNCVYIDHTDIDHTDIHQHVFIHPSNDLLWASDSHVEIVKKEE